MAALERYFLAKGKKIAGYDRTVTELTRALEREGVEIVYDENPDLIPDYCCNRESTLVVYTPAVPESHEGLRFFRQHGFKVVKRAKLLGIVTEHSKGLCFAGTHGKTTTSSMADELYLLPIYPAREQPIAGVTSEIILNRVTCPVRQIYTKEHLLSSIHLLNCDVLLTVGAGDIANLLPQICEEVKKQQR